MQYVRVSAGESTENIIIQAGVNYLEAKDKLSPQPSLKYGTGFKLKIVMRTTKRKMIWFLTDSLMSSTKSAWELHYVL